MLDALIKYKIIGDVNPDLSEASELKIGVIQELYILM